MPANLRVALSRDTDTRRYLYPFCPRPGAVYIRAVVDGGTGLKSHQHAASALRLRFQVLTTRFTVFKYIYIYIDIHRTRISIKIELLL